MFERIGVLAYRLRYLIVIVWVIAAVLSVKFAPSLASAGAADQASFLPGYAPSVQAGHALEAAFPGAAASSSATLTFSRDDGLTDADRAYLESVATWTTSADAPRELRDAVLSVDSAVSRPELASMLRSSDGVLELLTVNLNVGSAGGLADTIVTQLRDHLAATAPVGLAVHVTGAAGITTDYIRAIQAGTDSTTLVTIVLVVIILLLIYRAPLAALVPLLTIGAAFVLARGVLGVLAAAGWQVSSLLDTFLVVLVFGVGTDYAIFLISRYREEVGHEDWHEAVRETVKRIGAVISASAATVIVGLAAMAFADFEMIRTTGPALGVAVFVTLLAGLTLAPALLGIFGHYLFWPLHMRTAGEGEPDGFFARLAAGVSRHPGVVTLALVIGLAIPILYVPQARTNFDTLAELPATSDARAGYDIVAAHLGKGRITQSTGLIDAGATGDMLAPAALAKLRATVLALEAMPGVDTVTSLVTPDGDGVVPDGFRPSVQLGTIADELDPDGAGTATDSASLLDSEVSDGLSSALDYVNALGTAFPDVAGRSEHRTTTRAIADAQAVVESVRAQSVVSTQLRALASAMTSTSSLATTGGSADTALLARYLDELAAAFPEVRVLPAFTAATAAAASLAKSATLDAAVDASNALQTLAVHFDAQPDATLSPASLANTASAREARRRAETTFAALPDAFSGLAAVFAGRSDDIFVPVGIGGDEAASLSEAIDAFVSQDRTATRLYISTTDDPYSITAFGTVRAAREMLASAAPSFSQGATAHLAGSTAQLADVQDVLAADFLRVGAITVLGILIVLVVLLRAIVAPLYLVGTVLLSYGSALGLSAFLFQEVLGHPGISFYLPLMVFVLLVALGADYNIFLMSRVREESQTRPIRDGIRIASGRTGAVITSAGLILAGTFGSMATAPLIVLFQVGVAVAIGVLIDTFLVRSILVPAITTLVGDRAWWPSGVRLGERRLVPVPVAAGGAVIAADGATFASDGTIVAAGEPAKRPHRRLAIALVLAALVPVTFAGLVAWSQSQGDGFRSAGVVDLDEGATVSLADGTSRKLDLGGDLSKQLAAGGVTDAFRWTIVDAADATDGLSSRRFEAVLTIPADFSRRIAAIQADVTGAQPAAALQLATSPGDGTDTGVVAREVRGAIAAAVARTATASYVEDVLLAVGTADATIGSASGDARSIADRTATLAADASDIKAVAGELAAGLDELASGATKAASGASQLAAGTKALADGTTLVADGTASVAAGAADTSAGAAALASGASQLASGLQALDESTRELPAQTATLASGASDLATGATTAASGASQLASGLQALDAGTRQLPVQTATLASGASDLATGATTAASGASQLAAGLQALKAQTTGFGAQAGALASGAAGVSTGATALSDGATQAAAGAASLATGVDGLSTSVAGYTSGVKALSDSCELLGGGPAVCAQLLGLATQGTALATGAGDVAAGAHGVADATGQVATGAAGVSQGAIEVASGTAQLAASAPQLEQAIAASATGASDLSTGVTALAGGATQLAAGTQQLAAGMVPLASGISKTASGASELSTGVTAIASGATTLAAGTQQLAGGMVPLASGVSSTATGASGLSTGVTALAGGAAQLATGSSRVAQGADRTATGAGKLAAGTADAATGVDQLKDAMGQVTGGARLVTSRSGLLSREGTSVADDAAAITEGLDTSAATGIVVPDATIARVAARAADPVVVDPPAADGTGESGIRIAPYVMALALWLGALVAFLVLPAGRRRPGSRWWVGPIAAFAAAAGLGIVGALLMVAGLHFGVGMDVAWMPALVLVAALAAAAFTAIIQALVVALGDRGWLVGLLLAAVQAAACGTPFPADSLPAPLAFLHPLLPVTWATDAFRACIEGSTTGLAPAVLLLAGSLVVALLAVLAVAFEPDRPRAAEAAPA